MAGLGLALLVVGLALPVVPPRLAGPRMALDEVVPSYQFGEAHEIRIAAPPERVLEAARAVTAREIRLFTPPHVAALAAVAGPRAGEHPAP